MAYIIFIKSERGKAKESKAKRKRRKGKIESSKSSPVEVDKKLLQQSDLIKLLLKDYIDDLSEDAVKLINNSILLSADKGSNKTVFVLYGGYELVVRHNSKEVTYELKEKRDVTKRN